MSKEMQIKVCTNINLLAGMYKELSEDEKNDAPQTDEQYRQCMESFLEHGNKAYVFVAGKSMVGYALVITDRRPYYLRHFYICRSERRKGYGKIAFDILLNTLDADTIDLDVFVWNDCGIAFWKSLGFVPRAHLMRFKKPSMS